jgi:hypothetical protein
VDEQTLFPVIRFLEDRHSARRLWIKMEATCSLRFEVLTAVRFLSL